MTQHLCNAGVNADEQSVSPQAGTPFVINDLLFMAPGRRDSQAAHRPFSVKEKIMSIRIAIALATAALGAGLASAPAKAQVAFESIYAQPAFIVDGIQVGHDADYFDAQSVPTVRRSQVAAAFMASMPAAGSSRPVRRAVHR